MPRVWIAEPSSAEEVREFLDANDYPFECWSVENLRLALLCRVGTPRKTYAWVWFNWMHQNDKALEMHVCVSRAHRGAWISPYVRDHLTALVEMLGATIVIARLPRAARFMRRLGFEVVGNIAFRFIDQEEKEEAPNGVIIRGQASEGNSGAAA